MDVRILGPLDVRVDGRAKAIGGPRPRAVLAVLALQAGRAVSAERLAAALWGEDAPPEAVKTVQVHVSRLRKALGDPSGALLATTPAGYRLVLGPEGLDAARFERAVTAARDVLTAGDADRAASMLRAALALWRGAPLEEFGWAPFAPAEIRRLEELRLAAVELRVEADLAAGRHSELIPELQRLTTDHPSRERLHGQLMVALYHSGRQAEALDAYRHARGVLVEQFGIEPGSGLREVHQAILVHDPVLDAEPAAGSARARRRGALPSLPNRTIGRAGDVRSVGARLCDDRLRLLTLTGPGGVGKTRLALEAAHAVAGEMADGAWFVSLAAVQRARDVAAAIISSLGVVPLAGESAEETVERFLAAKQILLLVDNCEHLMEAAPFIGRLAAAGSGVTVLATSREPLGVQAEHVYPVRPLALPETGTHVDLAAVAHVDAVALFCERATAHDSEFELSEENAGAVAAICRRLDGLPLAIELAAARCGLLSAGEIAARLHAALRALGTGARDLPARQRTLRATLDWSHGLLDADEQTCFARFAVFAGGATVQAAETITGAGLDTLERLVAKSLLVRRRGESGSRLAMLETVREYAGERFAGLLNPAAVRKRHFGFFLELARCHGTEPALDGPARREHLACLDAEVANLRAALDWATEHDARGALELSVRLVDYWMRRDRYPEAVERVLSALRRPDAPADPGLRARALCKVCWPLWALGHRDELIPLLSEAEAIAGTLAEPARRADVLRNCAAVMCVSGRAACAAPVADEALAWANAAADEWMIATAAQVRAMAARSADELRDRVERAASLLGRVRNDGQLAGLFTFAAGAALGWGRDRDAADYLERALPPARAIGRHSHWLLGNVGLVALLAGDSDAAREAFREELALSRDVVVPLATAQALSGLAAVAASDDKPEAAARLAGAGAAHRSRVPDDPLVARLDTTFLEPARTRFGAQEWDAAFGEGAALSLEEAIVYGLAGMPAPSTAGLASPPPVSAGREL